MALTLPLLLLAQKGVDTSIFDSQTSDLSVEMARLGFYCLLTALLGVVLLGITGELGLSLGERMIARNTGLTVQHLLQRSLQHVPPEPLEGLGGHDGGGHEAGVDDVREDSDRGLGHRPRLLELSEHSPQESLVVVGEG